MRAVQIVGCRIPLSIDIKPMSFGLFRSLRKVRRRDIWVDLLHHLDFLCHEVEVVG
jgi:hypothetical protein